MEVDPVILRVYKAGLHSHTRRGGVQNFPHIQHVQICGGEAGTSRIAVRRRMKHGPNLDLVVGVDLTVLDTQRRAYDFFVNKNVLEAVMEVCKV